MVERSAKPRLAHGYRFQFEPAQNCHVLLYPEGMVQLSDSAAEVLQLCTGEATVEQIISALQEKFGESDLSSDILEFLKDADEQGWIATT